MASLQQHRNGRYRVRFYLERQHKALNLPKCQKKQAESIVEKVERLIEAKLTGEPPAPRVLEWLNQCGDQLHGRLVNAGLADPRIVRSRTVMLADFIDEYIAEQTTAEGTVKNLRHAKTKLLEYFGDRQLRSITPGDADRWLRQLPGAHSTRRRFLGAAKSFFRSAYRLRLIDEDPFEDLRRPSATNAARQQFITRETIDRVLAQVTQHDVRLALALTRYGGLRHTSETFLLRWSDILWSEGRFRIKSPKTASRGKPERVAPLFPELVPYLEAAFDAAPEGAEFCLGDRRVGYILFYVKRAIQAAGVEQWPKLFVNLRSSRQTELEQAGHPTHVVCSWLGNTENVARDHYLQVTDADFEAALKRPATAETTAE